MKKKAIVDWDFGSSGLWLVASRIEDSELQRLNQLFAKRDGADGWRGLISPTLLLEVKNWNEIRSEISSMDTEVSSNPTLLERLRSTQMILAKRVEDELGRQEWEVLFSDLGPEGFAWTWVSPPWE